MRFNAENPKICGIACTAFKQGPWFCKNSGTFFPVVNSVSRKNFDAILRGCLHVAMEDISAGLTEGLRSAKFALVLQSTSQLYFSNQSFWKQRLHFPFSILSISCFSRNAEPHMSRLGDVATVQGGPCRFFIGHCRHLLAFGSSGVGFSLEPQMLTS